MSGRDSRTDLREDVHASYIAPKLDARVWGPPAEKPAHIVAPQRPAWCMLAEGIYGTIDEQGVPWLAATVGQRAAERYGFGHDSYLRGSERCASLGAVALRYEPTPERVAAIRAALPAWVEPEVLEAFRTTPARRFMVPPLTDGYGRPLGEPTLSTATLFHVEDVPPGRLARFDLTQFPRTRWAACTRDALNTCWHEHIVLNEVTVEEGVYLVAGRASWEGAWSLWSDGRIIRGGIASTAVADRALSDAALTLVGAAVRQKSWTENPDWPLLLERLMGIEGIETTEQLDHVRHRIPSGAEETSLQRLTLRAGDDRPILYRVVWAWGVLGEDGEAGDEAKLFIEEKDALRAFREYAVKGARAEV